MTSMGEPSIVRKESERGQVFIFMAIAITALLAMAGLVIDGGRLYAEKNRAQVAADAAVMSAARALCVGENYSSTALSLAAANGFDNNGTTNTVTINYPPGSGNYVGDPEYVEVTIDLNIPGSFITLVYSGPLTATSRAVGYCKAGSLGPVGNGNAIIALNPSAMKAFSVVGNGDVIVTGGITVDSSHSTKALMLTGNGDITADSISIVGGYKDIGNGSINPIPTTGAAPIGDPLASVSPPPKPSGACIDFSLTSIDDATIDPGLYCQIRVTGAGSLTMNPGIYYIEGGEFVASGNGDIIANGVTIYLTGGKFSLTGNGNFNLSPPSSGDFTGMVLYMDRSNPSAVAITGNGISVVMGTIYGAASEIKVTGNGSSTVLNSQIIGDKITTTGNGDIIVTYDPDQNYKLTSYSSIGLAE